MSARRRFIFWAVSLLASAAVLAALLLWPRLVAQPDRVFLARMLAAFLVVMSAVELSGLWWTRRWGRR